MGKKIAFVLLLVVLGMSLTGCQNFWHSDISHAIVTVVSSSGEASVFESYNGNGSWSGKQFALRDCPTFSLEEGSTFTLTFHCDACGYEQELSIDGPYAEMLSCECPEEGDEEGNEKEYFCVRVNLAEE